MAKKRESFNRPSTWPPPSSSPLERGLWPWWLAVVAYVAIGVGSVLAGFAAFALPEHLRLAWLPFFQQFLFLVLAVLIPILAVSHFRPSYLGLRRVPWGRALLGAAAFVAVINLGEFIITTTSGNSSDTESDLVNMGLGSSLAAEIGIVLAITVVAPVAEELIVRGVIYRSLRDSLSRFGTVVGITVGGGIATMVFVDLHDAKGLTIGLFVLMGVAMIALYEWTGSLLAPIVAHSLNNSLAILFVMTKVAPTSPLIAVAVAGGPILATLLALFLQRALKPLSK